MIQVNGALKAQLAIWLIATVAGLGGLLLIEAYTSANRAADQAYDSQLAAAGLTIAEAIQWQGGQPIIELPAAALQILATNEQERIFYAVLDSHGRTITANRPLAIKGAWRESVREQPIWLSMQHDSTSIRLHGRELNSAGWESQEPVQIWVGHTLTGRRALGNELFKRSLTRLTLMMLLAGLLMFLAMRAALIPMRRLRQQLRQRTADDIRPLNATVPEELYELAETLNTLFARQREGRDALLRFTADASHQLKTPLAGLQSISELALESSDPAEWRRALATVHLSAERTSRLASQLLSLARFRHVAEDEIVLLDLTTVLRDTVMEWADRDSAKQHDLGLAPLPSIPCLIRGESWALREMIGNLIDNALRYTPPDSEITLGLQQDDASVLLFIEDNGPGVDDALLVRLHRPFERGGRQDTGGSGLGLAIVDSIVKQHDAVLRVTKNEPRGLHISVRFPLVSSSEHE